MLLSPLLKQGLKGLKDIVKWHHKFIHGWCLQMKNKEYKKPHIQLEKDFFVTVLILKFKFASWWKTKQPLISDFTWWSKSSSKELIWKWKRLTVHHKDSVGHGLSQGTPGYDFILSSIIGTNPDDKGVQSPCRHASCHTCTLRWPTFWSPVCSDRTFVEDSNSMVAQTFSGADHSCTCSQTFDTDLSLFQDVFWISKQTADFYWLLK